MILEVCNVTKQFGGVTAIKDTSFSVKAKEIYGLNTWCVDAISFKSLYAILTNIQNGVKFGDGAVFHLYDLNFRQKGFL